MDLQSSNNIGDAGFCDIAEALKLNNSLQELSIVRKDECAGLAWLDTCFARRTTTRMPLLAFVLWERR